MTLKEIGRTELRKKIWDELGERKQLLSRRPPYKLIPNFKGSDVVANRLFDVDEIQNAKTVVCNSDRSLSYSRIKLIEGGKLLYVTQSNVRNKLLKRITSIENNERRSRNSDKMKLTEEGINVDLEERFHIDVVLLSSVVVSVSGQRIGKDDTFADLEYGILASLGFVDNSTLIATAVHDIQVVDLDPCLLTTNDVLVNLILTPTRIIQCEGGKQMDHIDWSILSRDVLTRVPLLQTIYDADCKAGRNVSFSAPETKARSGFESREEDGGARNETRKSASSILKTKERGRSKYTKACTKSEETMVSRNLSPEPKINASKSKSPIDGPIRRQRPRLGGRFNRNISGTCGDSNASDMYAKPPPPPSTTTATYKMMQPSVHREPTVLHETAAMKCPMNGNVLEEADNLPALYIGGLVRGLRMWELRRMIKDHNVRPLYIVRPPFVGYAFLHFKTLKEVGEAAEQLSKLHLIDSRIRVEVAKRTLPRCSPNEHQYSSLQ